MKRHLLVVLVLAASCHHAVSQSTSPCLSQNFDSVTAPDLPPGWHVDGFAVGASVPRSAPNAAVATGNMRLQEITGPVCELAGWLPLELVFHERRSSTAAGYRLEVSGSADAFKSLAFRVTFESVPVLSMYVQRSVDLSSVWAHTDTLLQVRWRILPDSTNATGVLRIDDVTLIVRSADDLAVDRLDILPPVVTTDDSLLIGACLRNQGVVAVTGYDVQFFLMPVEGGLAGLGDRFALVSGPFLAPGDSVIVWAGHPPLGLGSYDVLVVAARGNDGNPLNDAISVRLCVGAAPHSVVINEIMYAPAGDEPEWIELLNVTADTISLEGWSVSDHGLARKSLTGPTQRGLAPGQYGVVARDGSFLSVHPAVSCPFFTAEFTALNNATPDGPLLYSDQGLTIDSVHYEPSWSGGQVGRTLERMDSDGPSTAASSWAMCRDSSGSTPGRLNSTARLAYDLAVTSLRAVTTDASAFRIGITVTNVGKSAVPEHEVVLFDDWNGDLRGDDQELLAALRGTEVLHVADSLHHEWSVGFESPGEHTVIAEVRSAADQRPSNDRAYAVLRVRHRPGVLVLNELMYEPLEGSCEWVELYNPSTDEVELRGWELSDAPTSAGSAHRVLISAQSRRVRPGDYVVIAGDSTILGAPYYLAQAADVVHLVVAGSSSGLGFANDGDGVVVRDLSGSTVDSLAYSPAMHHPAVVDIRGRSLERIRPEGATNDRSNWSTASGPRGGSPGARNTIAVSAASGRGALSIEPNPFSPDQDGWEDFCVISVELPFSAGVVRARVFDTRGRMVRTLANAETVGARTQIIWNGLDDRRGRVPVGPYVVLVEAADALSGARIVHKAVAVVGTRL